MATGDKRKRKRKNRPSVGIHLPRLGLAAARVRLRWSDGVDLRRPVLLFHLSTFLVLFLVRKLSLHIVYVAYGTNREA
ncbi:hypothetical protein LY78DRAFT_339740 [Colletotrichum sublineola]|nr:hypothetical protein LY78DRAFT_339740 [Colletotrichum sublineola]